MDNAVQGERPGRGATTEVHLETDPEGFRGTVRITPAVLIQLIDLTVQGIDGFAGLRNHDLDGNDVGTGKRFSNGKIAVTVEGDQIAVALGCAITRDGNVDTFSADVRRAIGFAVGNMLNMTVKSVDLIIQDVESAHSGS